MLEAEENDSIPSDYKTTDNRFGQLETDKIKTIDTTAKAIFHKEIVNEVGRYMWNNAIDIIIYIDI